VKELNKIGNKEKEWKSTMKFLEVLSDGQPHQVKDLKVYTKISPRTLYKNLSKLEPLIERFEEKRKGKPKPSVYYRASRRLFFLIAESKIIPLSVEEVLTDFSKDKDLGLALKRVNDLINGKVFVILSILKKSNIKDQEVILYLLRTFVFMNFEVLMFELVRASMKFINELDLEQIWKE
jgi:hypothetical protein